LSGRCGDVQRYHSSSRGSANHDQHTRQRNDIVEPTTSDSTDRGVHGDQRHAHLNTALNQGLDAGLTISETREILVQLYAYVGFPRSLNALNELMTVVQARKQRGIDDAPGREPGRAIPTGDELLAAGTANQTRISGGPVKGPVFEFAPVINRFLQTHLFGDIFERDNLDWQSRELATVGALAATPGWNRSCARTWRRACASVSARHSCARYRLLKKHGDAQTAERADTALTQALAASGHDMKAAKHLLCLSLLSLLAACANHSEGPLLIQKQGSFAAGGTMITAPGTFNPRQPMAPNGQTYHGDHAYAFYQIPVDARKLPIVMWHGAGQFSKTWETTADGREGFRTSFCAGTTASI
jgi:alkylhydroperoxidase/carboxymuconolactone decarboxylase family protein YurZ